MSEDSNIQFRHYSKQLQLSVRDISRDTLNVRATQTFKKRKKWNNSNKLFAEPICFDENRIQLTIQVLISMSRQFESMIQKVTQALRRTKRFLHSIQTEFRLQLL